MIKFLIEYAINKNIIKRVFIEAATLTKAYIEFLVRFPEDYEITDIREANSPAEA